ncbi:hypothetical protein BKA65DRAFT_580330 [Rhexocercosporidium sp. MPI-PUGE-AT-0058]|nr:hypothetical protein BKA65DRAFT_580330 [Rhexocercosporidium sp. MPI-PUGE-AT-0058]
MQSPRYLLFILNSMKSIFLRTQMEKHRKHRRVRDYNLHAGLAEVFTPGLHYPTYLAEKAILFSKFRGEQLGRLQKLAIHRFHGEGIFDLRPEATDIPDSVVLMAYFQFFDELFFFGSLGGSKRFILNFDHRLAEKGGPRGKYSKREVLNVQDGIHDRIYELLIFRQRGKNQYYSLRAALGFMLQGMCHTFLKLWQCRTDECSEMWSEYGAGWAWQDMALAIEDAISDSYFVNLDITLGRIEMLVDSLAAYPAFLTDAQLRKWRIDPEGLAKMTGRK